jgi:hypothetical protein
MSTNLAITGWKGHKEGKEYIAPKELLKKGYDFIVEKGLDLLKISEINAVTVGDTYGSDMIGIKLAQTYNVTPTVKTPEWDKYSDKKVAAANRYKELLKDADKLILFRNNEFFGGEAILKEAEALDIDVLCYDFNSDTYVVSKGKDLREALQLKPKENKLDYQRIARILLMQQAIVTDTETTGVGEEDRIIQLALVDSTTSYVYFQSLIKNEAKSSPKALEVHGITEAKRRRAPHFKEIYPAVKRFFSYPIVAYNANFDYRMIKREFDAIGEEFPVLNFVDLMPLCTAKFGERMKLGGVCEVLGIEPGTHDAASDAIAAAEVLRRLAE